MPSKSNKARHKTITRRSGHTTPPKLMTPVRAAGHFASVAFTIAYVWWTGQSPRVLLYACLFAAFARIFCVAALVELRKAQPGLKTLLDALSRPPARGERSKPYRHPKTRQPKPFVSYLGIMAGVVAALFPLLWFGSGNAFLRPDVLLPEMGWGLLLATAYSLEDIFAKAIVLNPDESTEINLGYNLRPLHVFLVALFAATFVFCFVMVLGGMLFGANSLVLEAGTWVIFASLVVVRQLSDVLAQHQDASRPRLT